MRRDHASPAISRSTPVPAGPPWLELPLRLLLLVLLGLLFALQPAEVRAARLEITATSGGSTGSISVDIDEPTKPGPDGDDPLVPPGLPQSVLQDTVWIANWSFDGAGCVGTGWTKYDNRVLNDGSNYWSVNASFSGTGGIVNNAAVLSKHDLGWARDGYGNNWDYSVILKYRGTSALSFDYASDSQPGFDFVSVESDSAGASEALVNYAVDPSATPETFRTVLLAVDGVQSAAAGPIALGDYGVAATTHEVYIRFHSDGSHSDEDGLYPTVWNAGLVVDNVEVSGGLAYSEGFEGALNPNVTLANTAPAAPFGEWARLFQHITDNDKCSENTSCAWLFTDPLRTAFYPDMAFGPGSAVIRNWLDDIIVSPWVSLASTPSATSTVLSYRSFPGNGFARGKIVLNWRVRSKVQVDNTDTSVPGDSIDTVTPWGHTTQFTTLSRFSWITALAGLSGHFSPAAREVQIGFRVSDWQYLIGDAPPVTLNPGPGPYLDRMRIGRRVATGPHLDPGIDTRSQAQDAFATVLNGISPGEHHSPATGIFGSAAFSMGTDLTINSRGPNLVTGDSITMRVVDARGGGGIVSVSWYGAITAGPHAGKAPAPYTVGANGFFAVTPDSARGPGGAVVEGSWFVDLDDTYFRGGDRLLYFWTAMDAGGGRGSFPPGLSAGNFPPASVAAAELATKGLLEVSFLPVINWDPTYLAAIAADPHGDIDPTPGQIANSSQKNCILYYNQLDFRRRSTDVHRTSFMYTLDRLGYRGWYDVYDVQGYGNTNNQLGGRANVSQASGYALIVEDDGRLADFLVPDGVDIDHHKINQAQWYRDYLAQGITPGGAPIANLWILGENTAFERAANPLFSADFGLTTVVNDQGLNTNPNVTGQANFTFSNGNVATFVGDVFSLNGGCPDLRNYDGAAAAGTAVITHRYTFGATNGTGAIVMNKNGALNWNTIWMGFPWFDIRSATGTSPISGTGTPDIRLARKILNAVMPVSCITFGTTDTNDPESETAPAVSVLHPNVPNPFNPTTRIEFDLARDGWVRLQIFDVTGKLVRTLVDGELRRGYHHSVTWNGLDGAGRRVASGVYLYRLEAGDFVATRKLIALK